MSAAPSQSAPLDLAQFEGCTPGPWTLLISDYDEDGLNYAEVERQSPRPYQAAQGICKIHGWGAAYSRDAEQKANAALIAAAPALLAECQRQRELLTEALRAWNHPTAESVNMRCRSMNAIRQHLSETEAK